MKIFLLVVFFFWIATNCTKSHTEEALSQEQMNLVQQMNTSYQHAKLYNDSLIYASSTMRLSNEVMIHNGDKVKVHYFDSCYHYNVQQFDSYHNQYRHDYSSADHNHNGMGEFEMHDSHEGMMSGQCCSNGGHSAEIHQKMSELHNLHSRYHPH